MHTVLKHSIMIGCCCGFFWGMFVLTVFAEEAPVAARQAAEQGLSSFLQAIPAQDLAHFNFSDPKELEQATLGEPFLIYTIAPESILMYQANTPVESIIVPTSVWYFPVLINGETRTLLMVDMINGGWKAVGIGSSGIAKQWAAVDTTRCSAAGYTPRFVRIFQAMSDFVVLSHRTAGSKMVPLASAGTALALDKVGEEYAPAVIIPSLQQAVRDNLQASESFK
jgi:hypothetical protein